MVMGDLMELGGVHAIADQIEENTDHIDLLLNNAGALFTSHALTQDGFERTWSLNHLAYHLLTTRLFHLVEAGSSPRIVNVASNAHRNAKMNWSDLQFLQGGIGQGWTTYCHSNWPIFCSPRDSPAVSRGPVLWPTVFIRDLWRPVSIGTMVP